jgi:hypothetical protein
MEQQVFEMMKRYMRFAKSPNYVNKNNEFKSTYEPLFKQITSIMSKPENKTIFTPAKVKELSDRADAETKAEIASRKTVLSSDMIIKKKLQILMNNYYSFINPRIALAYQQRNAILLSEIENRPAGIDITELDKKAMDQAIILILRYDKPNMSELSSLEIRKTQLNIEISSYTTQMQTQTEQKKRITENQIRGLNRQLFIITNKINALNKSLDNYNKNILPKTQAYIQKTFYDKPTDSTKPDYSSYFTEEKKNELIKRSNNATEIPQIESFQETMAPSKWDIGVM